MARGGKRTGAGRKPGKKDAKPRGRQKKLVSKGEALDNAITNYEEVTQPLFLQISKYISKSNRKLYKDLASQHKTPLDSLRALRDDLVVRYNYARVAEIEGVEHAKNIAIQALQELEKKGTIDGKKIPEKEKQNKINSLQKTINEKPKINTAVTTLATEIRQMNELIDRIESNRQDLTLNIFNILSGTANKKETEALRNRIFDLPKDVDDAEFKEKK